MNSQELSQKLVATGGMLTISADTLGAAFGSFLDFYYAGQPITLSGAQRSAEAQPDGALVYTGTSNFGALANLPTVARFSLDKDGAVVVELRYRLRGAVTEVNPWVFSRSFPDLPKELNYLTTRSEVMLDTLDLYDSWFVVVTAAGADRDFGVPLAAGLNFVSHLRPRGLLGVFEHVAGESPATVIYGVIIPPKASDLVVELKPLEHAWDRLGGTSPPPPPGIYLQSPLDLNFTLGKLSIAKTMLRTYTPISNAWMDANPGFLHKQGYTATLAIPSAKIQVELGADMQLGIPVAMLYGNCHGVSLGKLEHLLDLAGTDGLLSNLPEELRKPVAALEKLELMQVGLDLVLSGLVPTLRSVAITIGFPNLKWSVWSDALVVQSLSCRFVIYDPFASSTSSATASANTAASKPSLPISATVTGILDIEGVPVSVMAGSDDGFMVRANTLAPANLPLDKLVKKHGAGVPVPTPLTINYLQVLAWCGKAYSMEALLAGDPKPWTIPVGKQALTISNISLYFLKRANAPITGRLSGKIELMPGLTLQATYQIPGSFIIRSTLPPMRLSKVIDQLCNRAVKLPSGLDFDLDYASILIQEQQSGTFLFQLCAQVKGLGVLAFEARKAGDGTWGFAYGIEILSAQPSQVGGLGALAALEKELHLRKFLIVASSLDQPGFQLPDTAQFSNPVLATKKVALPGSGGVSAGLNIFAEWSLDSNSKQQRLLKTLLGLGDAQQVTIQVGENPAASSKLFFSNAGKIQGHPFQYKLGMQLVNGAPSLFLTGSITMQIQKQPQTFDVTTLFVPNGAFLSATMKGTKPVNCGPFSLSNLAVEIGVDWAGIPSLGITGNIDVKSFQSSIAIFFDSTNPANSLVAGAVSDLTLREVVDTMLGTKLSSSIDEVLSSVAVQGTHEFAISAELADELDQLKLPEIAAAFLSAGKLTIPSTSSQLLLSVNKAGESWHLTDLTKMRHYQLKKKDKQILVSVEAQFYFAPQATSIGTIAFPQGYYINGAIKILGWQAQATIDIATNKGISVEAEMDKISLGPGGLFTITAASGGGGPRVSISTMAQPQSPVAEYRNPHFYINGAVQLFGIQEKVLASLTTKGLLIDIKGALAPGVEFDLDAVVGGSGLSVDGDIKVGIGTIDLGPLGKVKVNTDVEGSLGIRISGQEVSLVVEASFDFLGEEQNLGKFSLESKPDALTRFAATLEKRVEEHLRGVFKDVGRWTNALKNGALDNVNNAEEVLTKQFGKSEKEAKELAKSAGKDVKVAEKAVVKTASKFGKKLKKVF